MSTMQLSPRTQGFTLAESVKVPASRMLLWELPFWLFLCYAALMPAKMSVQKEWFGIPVNYGDLAVLLGGLFYGVSGALGLLLGRAKSIPFRALAPTILIIVYAATTLCFSSLEDEDVRGMAFTLALTLAAPCMATGLMTYYTPSQVKVFLDRFLLFLALVSVVYAAESIFDLGLRSEEGRNLGVDFGIQRVRGPLYGPSTGYFLLLPAIGWGLYGFFTANSRRFRAAFCIVSLLVALLGLGSRAALILLAAYLITLALLMKSLKKKVLTVLLILALSSGAATLIYGQADTQRLKSFEDSFRQTTHETVLNLITSESLLNVLAGQGYGTLWSWYRRDTLRGEWVAIGDNTILTPFGPSLYHSHSTLLLSVAELGLPGLCWLGSLLVLLFLLPLQRGGDTAWRAFAWALAISSLSLCFDLFFFKSARVNAVWWVFFIGAIRLLPGRQRRTL